jgi:ethanolamine utilization cobalamin adenosyltransferase
MRTLTEADLRASLQTDGIKEYSVPPDVFVTPAAKEYLRVRGISLVVRSGDKTCFDETRQAKNALPKSVYIDAVTGRGYDEKPENMTHLRKNLLVPKTHPVIAFRGKIDTLQADIILAQAAASGAGLKPLVSDLQETLLFLRAILGAEVKNSPLDVTELFGLSFPELRRVSHDIKAELGLEKHPVPDYSMGELPAAVNALRARTREAELAALEALPDRQDILTALNRLSSGMHIIFCRLLSGYYN